MEDAPEPPAAPDSARESVLGCLATLLLFLFCLATPPILFRLYGPLWGLLAVAASEALFVRLGPPAFPGFLPGLLQMTVLLWSLSIGLTALWVLVKHLVHHGAY